MDEKFLSPVLKYVVFERAQSTHSIQVNNENGILLHGKTNYDAIFPLCKLINIISVVF